MIAELVKSPFRHLFRGDRLKYLGRGNKNFNKGGKLDQGVDALKRRGLEPPYKRKCRRKYSVAGFLMVLEILLLMKTEKHLKFIMSMILKELNKEELIIPWYIFEVEPTFLLLKLPYCEKNEAKSRDFIRKFHKFTNNQFQLAISWNTKKLSSLFRLKDKNLYPTQHAKYTMVNISVTLKKKDPTDLPAGYKQIKQSRHSEQKYIVKLKFSLN